MHLNASVFMVYGLTQARIELEFAVLEADALST